MRRSWASQLGIKKLGGMIAFKCMCNTKIEFSRVIGTIQTRMNYDLVQVISMDLLFIPSTTTFLTGIGLFGAYPSKFKSLHSSLYVCGNVALAYNYFYSCSLKTRWYICRPPVLLNSQLSIILSRPTLLSKHKNTLNFLCNLSILFHH